ncbi:MAG: hypothetical protein LLG00_16195 [Planctomycetaceae bacterium]|nr:hypothetical protein [Planctomycetaceae bacterium]
MDSWKVTSAVVFLSSVLVSSVQGGTICYAVTDLGSLGGVWGCANDVNAGGQVVGQRFAANGGVNRAFLFHNGATTDIGDLTNGGGSCAYAINLWGQVVGGSCTGGSGAEHAFLFNRGVITDLGTLGGRWSCAYGINDKSQVVGAAYTADDAVQHAFLYSNGAMTDLNSLIAPGWELICATAINNNGLIVGMGVNSSGQADAFLLTPTPEPSALVILGIGAVSLSAYFLRARQGIGRGSR